MRVATDIFDPAKDSSLESIEHGLELVRSFNPDVIYYRPLEARDELHELAMRSIAGTRANLVTHIMDDWPSRLKSTEPERARRYDEDLRRLFSAASRNLSICSSMSTAFAERYNTDFAVLANGVGSEVVSKLTAFRQDKEEEEEFVLRYMGGLAHDMTLRSMMNVAEAIRALRASSLKIRLEIFTMQIWQSKIGETFSDIDGVSVFSSVDIDTYYRLIATADACIIAYNFDQESLQYVRYSMANKLPEIMASGTVLFAYGPREQATIDYIGKEGIGILVDRPDPDLLADTLRKMVKERPLRKHVASRAFECFQQRHRMEEISDRFMRYLVEAAAVPRSWGVLGPGSGLDRFYRVTSPSGGRLAFEMKPTKAVVLPTFESPTKLRDFLARAAWFLPQTSIEKLVVFATKRTLDALSWQLPDGFDPIIAEKRFSRLKRVLRLREISEKAAGAAESYFKAIEEADAVYFTDAAFREALKDSSEAERLKSKLLFNVDSERDKNEGAAYLDTAMRLMADKDRVVDEHRLKFEDLAKRLGRFDRGFALATGPSIADYRRFCTDGAFVVACNSIIKNMDLMEEVRPQVLVFADPVFHYGPSAYAAAFRTNLRDVIGRFDFHIITPLKYYATLVDMMPEAKDRSIAVPFDRDCGVVLDLRRDYRVNVTDNILTLLMLPIAFTFARDVIAIGCDGRPIEENDYFWTHNASVQYVDQMSNIKGVHPSFFDMDYDDYYNRHLSNVDRYIRIAEAEGKSFTSGGFSYLPAMAERSNHSRISAGGVASGQQRAASAAIVDIGPLSKERDLYLARYKATLEGVTGQSVNILASEESPTWWEAEVTHPKAADILDGLIQSSKATILDPGTITNSSPPRHDDPSRALRFLSDFLDQNTENETVVDVAQIRQLIGGLGQGLQGTSATGPLRLGNPWIGFSSWLGDRTDNKVNGTAAHQLHERTAYSITLNFPLSSVRHEASTRPGGSEQDDSKVVIDGSDQSDNDGVWPDGKAAASNITRLSPTALGSDIRKALSGFDGLVYYPNNNLRPLIWALKRSGQDLRRVELVVDLQQPLASMSKRRLCNLGRAVAALLALERDHVSTIRIRVPDRYAQDLLADVSGMRLEVAPPLDPVLSGARLDRLQGELVRPSAVEPHTPMSVVIVSAAETRRRMDIAIETAMTLIEQGYDASLCALNKTLLNTSLPTPEKASGSHLSLVAMDDVDFPSADLLLFVDAAPNHEFNANRIMRRAILARKPLVAWSQMPMARLIEEYELGSTYGSVHKNPILRAFGATCSNLPYFAQNTTLAAQAISREGSWHAAAAGLFAAGLRPAEIEGLHGIRPSSRFAHASAERLSEEHFLLPDGKDDAAMFVFEFPVKTGERIRATAHVRVHTGNAVPTLRLSRHSKGPFEQSQIRDCSTRESELIEDAIVLSTEHTFEHTHDSIRARLSTEMSGSCEVDVLDVRVCIVSVSKPTEEVL